MRLLNTNNFEIREFADDRIPRYAILSHTWGEGEVTFQEMEGTSRLDKKGYDKIRSCCSRAKADGFEYIWIDTCCIDKTSSAELTEAINSMYRWYQKAERCYAYLADVPSKSTFSNSKWFTRGWTLQELIAPSTVFFLDEDWNDLGTKASTGLLLDVSHCTGIPRGILSGIDALETASVAQRMSWAAKRQTTRVEDKAYCLMGLFGVNMPLLYGERERAFIRLQEEIMRVSDDHSLFAWRSTDKLGGLLATSPAAFEASSNIVPCEPFVTFTNPLTITNKGIHLRLRFIGTDNPGVGFAVLHCTETGREDMLIAIYLGDLFLTMEHFGRVWCERLELLNLEDFSSPQYSVRTLCIRQRLLPRETTILYAVQGRHKDKSNTQLALRVIETDLKDEDARMALWHAAKRGNLEVVWFLLTKSGVQADCKDYHERTPLSHAAGEGHLEVVWLLLTRVDVDASSRDRGGRTPLSHAARGGHKAMVELFLARSDIDTHLVDGEMRTPLSYAVESGHEDIIKLLLKNGAEAESKAEKSRTPLSFAAERGHEAIVKLLLKNGARAESKAEDGRTPLWWATRNRHEAIVKLLLERGAEAEAKDKSGHTPLWWATKNRHEAAVKLLLEKGANTEAKDKGDHTPLWLAVANRHEAVVKLLLERGADIEAKDRYGHTPLMWAAENRNTAIAKLLLEKEADLAKNRDGQTPLFSAAQNWRKGVVKLLGSKT